MSTDEAPIHYTICNGMANQFLGHSAGITKAITEKRSIVIPNAFIINGVQSNVLNGGTQLIDITPNKDVSIPLSYVIDTDDLIQTIKKFGIEARLMPLDEVLALGPQECNWLSNLMETDNTIALKILQSLKPSPDLKNIMQKGIDMLQSQLGSKPWSEGICLHHRDGKDWHDHCTVWGNIDDGVWRKNCEQEQDNPFETVIRNRIRLKKENTWIYYVGDHDPNIKLEVTLQADGIDILNNNKMGLEHSDIQDLIKTYSEVLPTDNIRDIWAVIDFFTCSTFDKFIGNSVSSWSAVQIAMREGAGVSWYNSKSIPMAGFLKVYNIPIVYTYTEMSQLLGKVLLKISIMSCRNVFGSKAPIHIIYHGDKDAEFLNWLHKHNIKVHNHRPTWVHLVEKMRVSGDPNTSHLYAHAGIYLGTWQRIDIPLFIDTEYCLFLDADTIVTSPFTLYDFGLDLTQGIAFSAELEEDDDTPANAGVALFNVPRLRETYTSFLKFIVDHANAKLSFSMPSDQGAYADYYKNDTQFLHVTYNVKPYWTNKETLENRKVVHFHGLKPNDILSIWLGDPPKNPALVVLTDLINMGRGNVCTTLGDFGKAALAEGPRILEDFCDATMIERTSLCFQFFEQLSHPRTVVESCREQILLPLLSKMALNKGRLKLHHKRGHENIQYVYQIYEFFSLFTVFVLMYLVSNRELKHKRQTALKKWQASD